MCVCAHCVCVASCVCVCVHMCVFILLFVCVCVCFIEKSLAMTKHCLDQNWMMMIIMMMMMMCTCLLSIIVKPQTVYNLEEDLTQLTVIYRFANNVKQNTEWCLMYTLMYICIYIHNHRHTDGYPPTNTLTCTHSCLHNRSTVQNYRKMLTCNWAWGIANTRKIMLELY